MRVEREYAREIVQAFNLRVADNLGVQIILHRWEDATPDLGEPQDLINSVAENCDLVVVVFWRRFGTPTRNQASGTLEEFENARKRWLKSGRPNVWVYFREIDNTLRDDPGPQLSHLLKFRERFEEQRLGLSCSYSDPSDFRYKFQTHLYQEIIETVLPSAKDTRENLPLGVMPVVSSTARADLWTLLRLRQYAVIGGTSPTFENDPVVINPPKGPVEVYAGGLGIVEKRFWTTAFLDSSYWTGGHPSVLTENQNMIARLRKNSGTARRLFIGVKQPREEAQWIASHIKYLQQHGRREEARDRKRYFAFLRDSMTSLVDSGFEIRVGTDALELYRNLIVRIDGTEFSPYKFGLTLYDNKRVDIFQEGKFGFAGNVYCFTPAMAYFGALLKDIETYFEQLWQASISFNDFIEVFDAES